MTDERLEIIVANLLRTGVLTSAAVVLAGGILYVLHHGGETANFRFFRGEPAAYTSPPAILHSALAGDARAIIQFGLLLLIATPVARVAISIVGFALEKDRTYIIITTIVLAILLFSLISQP